MKRIGVAAAAAVTIMALSACSPSVSGTVVDKEFDKGTCKTTWKTVNGKKKSERKCSADEYELDIRKSDGSTVEIDVSRSAYDRAVIGQEYRR